MTIHEKFLSIKQILIYHLEEPFVYFEKDILVKQLPEKIDRAQSTLMTFLKKLILIKRLAMIFIKNFLNIISIY